MDSDEEDEYALPPSPSPAPRTRPRGPRGIRPVAAPTTAATATNPAGPNAYAHQRQESSSSFSSYKGVATTAQAALTIKPSIRPVTDESLMVFNAAKSPYPTRPSQILYPPGAQNFFVAAEEGFKIVDVARNSGSGKSNSFQQQTQEFQSSSNNSHNDWPTTNTTNKLTTSDTPKVRNQHTLLNASLAPVFESPSLPILHNEPRLVPLSAQASRSFPYKTSPGEFVDIDDYTFTSSPYYHSSTGIDVDRLAMVEGSYNANNDHLDVPPFLTPREQQHQHGSSSSPLEPGTVSTSQRSSGGLGAIASAASDLTFNSTPSSTGESVDSSGTVVRKKGYTGPLPAGYYSLFPPVATPPPETPRQATIPTNQSRSRRSSSAPPRPVSEGPLSPISGGTNSPVSPISPEDNDSLYTSSRPQSRSRSESLFNIGQAPSLPSVLVAGYDSTISSQPTIHNQIPRKPVSRSNAVRWNSFMSTIHSESEADARSSVQKSLNDNSSDSNNTQAPKSATSSTFKLREEFRRSSSALPLPLDANEVALPNTSATLDFSQIDTAFPLAEPQQEESIQQPRRRVSKGRMDSTATYASLPSQPNRKQSNAVTSPTSLYSTRLEYRDSHSQTDSKFRGGRTGSLLRDSLPIWARYTHNSLHGQNVREPAPGPLSPNYGSITCPNCSERWSPAMFSNFSHLSSHSVQPSKAVKFNATENRNTDESQRLYYSNEARHRETLGHVPVRRISNRRHTVGSVHNHTDSLRNARDREANSARMRSPHSRHMSLPVDRSVFRGEDVQIDKIPHLSHNRAAAIRRRTLFLAPSIDEVVEGKGLTRRNIQVWSFAIGFIFPFGMFNTIKGHTR